MAGPYAYMTDQELTDELAAYRTALRTFALGGSTKVIAGEGRRKEFNAGDSATLKTALKELEFEYASRPSLAGLSGGPDGGSLIIEFGHGGLADGGAGAFYDDY